MFDPFQLQLRSDFVISVLEAKIRQKGRYSFSKSSAKTLFSLAKVLIPLAIKSSLWSSCHLMLFNMCCILNWKNTNLCKSSNSQGGFIIYQQLYKDPKFCHVLLHVHYILHNYAFVKLVILHFYYYWKTANQVSSQPSFLLLLVAVSVSVTSGYQYYQCYHPVFHFK